MALPTLSSPHTRRRDKQDTKRRAKGLAGLGKAFPDVVVASGALLGAFLGPWASARGHAAKSPKCRGQIDAPGEGSGLGFVVIVVTCGLGRPTTTTVMTVILLGCHCPHVRLGRRHRVHCHILGHDQEGKHISQGPFVVCCQRLVARLPVTRSMEREAERGKGQGGLGRPTDRGPVLSTGNSPPSRGPAPAKSCRHGLGKWGTLVPLLPQTCAGDPLLPFPTHSFLLSFP